VKPGGDQSPDRRSGRAAAMPPAWLGAAATTGRAPLRLLCFAHAGGGAAFFHGWRQALLPDIDVCPVILPGREARLRERPHTRTTDLVPILTAALEPFLDRPYALFGHSMGAMLAYETARVLDSGPLRPPLCLIASGRRAPQLPARRAPLYALPEPAFLHAVTQLGGMPEEVLDQPDVFRLFLPALRADFELNETYEHTPGPPLRCPVSALVGDTDPEVGVEEMAAWRPTTSGAFTLRVFRGGHFYHRGRPAEVLAAIRSDVTRAAAAAGASAQS
jgi:surfactin synthase thioesterase subunit